MHFGWGRSRDKGWVRSAPPGTQFVTHRAEQNFLAQDAVPGHAAIAMVEYARPLRPRLEIGRDRARANRARSPRRRAGRPRSAASCSSGALPQLLDRMPPPIAPRIPRGAIEIGLQDEHRIISAEVNTLIDMKCKVGISFLMPANFP